MRRQEFTENEGSRRTGDGLKIYTEDEPKIGKGGNRAQCPIDCDCCF